MVSMIGEHAYPRIKIILNKGELNETQGKPRKKVIFLMAGPLRPNPPPSLMAVGTFFFSLKIAENGF